MPRRIRPLFERWDEKVERTDGCWLWRGAVKENGYGVIQRGARGQGLIRAHVFAYQHFVGPIPEGLEMRHSCHVRHCVNPAHLSPGTRSDNMQDCWKAGRHSIPNMRGADNGMAKLTWEQAEAIRGDSRILREVATDYGVSIQCVWQIRTGKTYVR